MDDIVYTLDREQRLTGVFGRWAEKPGRSRESVLGKTARDLYGVEAAAVHEQMNERALNGESVVYEWSMTGSEGLMFFQTRLSPLRDATGGIAGIVGVNYDITDRKRIEGQLQQFTEELKRSNTDLEQFAYIASHDLQEPLRMVSNFTNLLEKRYSD